MAICRDFTTIIGCYDDGVSPKQPVVITYVHDAAGNPSVLITDVSGAIIAGADETNTSPGLCTDCTLVGTGGATIAGPTRSATAAFTGASDVFDSASIAPYRILSITVSARGVVDGITGQTTDQIIISMSNNSTVALMDGETRTFSVVKDFEGYLINQLFVTAFGNAYANVTYTYDYNSCAEIIN